MATFLIPEQNMAKLDAAIAKLNKKAKKVGAELATTNVLGVTMAEVVVGVTDRGNPIYGTEYAFQVEVVGVSPKFPGWEFVGTIEHTEVGNILRGFPGSEIPEDYRHKTNSCDHCKTKRYRKNTYLVKNEAGELKQVGHSCVRDFLGHVSPEHLAYLAEFLEKFQGLTEGSGSGRSSSVPFDHFLSVAAEIILTEGYTSSQYGIGTGSQALINILDAPFLKMKRLAHEIIVPSERAKQIAKESLEWHETAMGDSSYAQNVKIAIKYVQGPGFGLITGKHANLIASMVNSYVKFQGEQKRKAIPESTKPSKFVGEIGTRGDLGELLLTKIVKIAGSSFGGSFDILLFRDASDNVYKWATGVFHDMEEGRTYKITGRIKKHEEFKGTKQTVITRCNYELVKTQQTA